VTLLEQLIALLITAIVLVAAAGMYRSTIENRGSQLEQREAQDIVRQIASMVTEDISMVYFSNEKSCSMVTDVVTLNELEQQLLNICTSAYPLSSVVTSATSDNYVVERPQRALGSAVQQVRYVARYATSGQKGAFSLIRQFRLHRTRQPQKWKELILASDVSRFSVKKRDETGVAVVEVATGLPVAASCGGTVIYNHTVRSR